jgi:hypothetical protein
MMVAGLAMIPLATSMLTLALFLGLMALGKSLNTPTITSLISQEADEENVGAVMGTAQGLIGPRTHDRANLGRGAFCDLLRSAICGYCPCCLQPPSGLAGN